MPSAPQTTIVFPSKSDDPASWEMLRITVSRLNGLAYDHDNDWDMHLRAEDQVLDERLSMVLMVTGPKLNASATINTFDLMDLRTRLLAHGAFRGEDSLTLFDNFLGRLVPDIYNPDEFWHPSDGIPDHWQRVLDYRRTLIEGRAPEK